MAKPYPAPVRKDGQPLRFLYAIGPGDIVDYYRDIAAGKPIAFQTGKVFSGPFLDWCESVDAKMHFISSNPRRDFLEVGPHVVENRPRSRLFNKGGIQHHIGTATYGFWLVWRAVRQREDMVIVDSGTTHWIVLSLLPMLGIPVLGVMHNTLWPTGFPPQRRLDKILRAMDGFFFRHFAAATVCVSPECERQLRQVTGKPKGPIYQCRAQYRRGFLERVVPVAATRRPFQTLFMGRMEENKGVLLIPAIAARLEKEMPGEFAWRIVGSGSAMEELERMVAELNLGHVVKIPGRVPDEQAALETFGWAHAILVPTTSRFREGLTMAAIEGVLAGRPVVVSTAVPVREVLGPAVIEAEADNVESFVEAFRKLALEPGYYEACQRATAAVQAQFYDDSQGLGEVLGRAITELKL